MIKKYVSRNSDQRGELCQFTRKGLENTNAIETVLGISR